MAKGTTFGAIHSSRDLHLIQQTVEITPPAPRINIIDIPGANGGKDLTEALGVGVTYQDCQIKWTFALYPRESWSQKRQEVANALNGLAAHIIFDDDPDWYYDGRLSVTEYATDGLLKQITVEATCRPYKRKLAASVQTCALTTDAQSIPLAIGAMPLIPEINVTAETAITWGDLTLVAQAGTHVFPTLRMSGNQSISAKVSDGTGSISIRWREGALA